MGHVKICFSVMSNILEHYENNAARYREADTGGNYASKVLFYVGEKTGATRAQLYQMGRHAKDEARRTNIRAFWEVPVPYNPAEVLKTADNKFTQTQRKACNETLQNIRDDPLGTFDFKTQLVMGKLDKLTQRFVTSWANQIVADAVRDQEHVPDVTTICARLVEAKSRGGKNIFNHAKANTLAELGTFDAPVFNASYRSTPYWRTAFEAIIGFMKIYHKDDIDLVVKAIDYTVKTWILSSGGEVGQFNRIKNTRAVGQHWRKIFPTERRVDAAYMADMRKAWKLEQTDFHKFKDMRHIYVFAATGDYDDHFSVVNLKSTAGPGYSKEVKRGDVEITEVFLANTIVGLMSELEDPELVGSLSAEKWSKEHRKSVSAQFDAFCRMTAVVWIKPKYEIMKIANLLTKVRNICVFPSWMQVVLSRFLTRLNMWEAKPLTGASHSLKGFSHMYCGMDSVIRQLFLVGFGFYSDNLYYMTPQKTLLSMDVEKMESTSCREEARVVMSYILANLGVPASALADYLIKCGADYCHDNRGSIGDYTMEVIGLMSGSVSTFLVNHGRMAVACTRIKRWFALSPDVLKSVMATPRGTLITIPPEVGVYFGLELTSTTADRYDTKDGSVSVSPYMDFTDAAQQPGTLKDFGPIVKADMLGCDVTTVVLPEDRVKYPTHAGKVIYLGALEFERTMKAIMFRKQKATFKNNKGSIANGDAIQLINQVTELSTLFTLYITGGYAYPETHMLITATAVRIALLMRDTIKSALKAGGITEIDAASDFLTNIVYDALSNRVDVEEGGLSIGVLGSTHDNAAAIIKMALGANEEEMVKTKFLNRALCIEHFHTEYGERLRAEAIKRDVSRVRERADRGKLKSLFGLTGDVAPMSIPATELYGDIPEPARIVYNAREKKPMKRTREVTHEDDHREAPHPPEDEYYPVAKARGLSGPANLDF